VVMPAAAANELPSSQFAIIARGHFQNLTRRLCIISNPKVLALRSTLRRVSESLERSFR